jgi:hypothetical protein
MKRQHVLTFALGAVAGVVAVFLSAAFAEAGYLSQLESVQNANGASRQFKFEGATAAARQNDSGGQHIDLLAAAGEGGSGTNTIDPDGVPDSGDESMVPWSYPAGDVNAIGYEAGYDGAGSQAMRPQSMGVTSTFAAEALAQRRSGAALYTDNFTTPTMLTVEAVVKADAYTESGGGPHYIFQTRPGAGRGYYLNQLAPAGSRNTNGRLATIVGSNFGENASVLPDYSDQSHWYYVVATFDLSGTNAVVNSWYQDLTAFQANPLDPAGELKQSQSDYNFAATIGAGLVGANGYAGVGMFVRPPNGTTQLETLGQEFFYGAIDNLAIYNGKLTPGQVAQHSRALTVQGVPEPASLVLLACSGLAFALVRRRAA